MMPTNVLVKMPGWKVFRVPGHQTDLCATRFCTRARKWKKHHSKRSLTYKHCYWQRPCTSKCGCTSQIWIATTKWHVSVQLYAIRFHLSTLAQIASYNNSIDTPVKLVLKTILAFVIGLYHWSTQLPKPPFGQKAFAKSRSIFLAILGN